MLFYLIVLLSSLPLFLCLMFSCPLPYQLPLLLIHHLPTSLLCQPFENTLVGSYPLLQMACWRIPCSHSSSLPEGTPGKHNMFCPSTIVTSAHWPTGESGVRWAGQNSRLLEAFSSVYDSKSLVKSPSLFTNNETNGCRVPPNTMPWNEHIVFMVFLHKTHKSRKSIKQTQIKRHTIKANGLCS